MSRKTKQITYNLSNRDRKHNGIDRSDVDIRSMINQINSPAVQELVASGDLFGYFGHEVRQRFGMTPPDVWINPDTGESIRIDAANRTIKLSADNDGNVTHQEEFLDNDAGDYAYRMYKNKVGGFSSAIHRRRGNAGKYEVTGFYGYDYLKSPNYNTNRGDGQFDGMLGLCLEDEMCFDGMENMTPQQIMMRSALESAIASQYDSMGILSTADELVKHYQGETEAAIEAAIQAEERRQNRQKRKEDKELAMLDSLLCPSKSFSSITEQWDGFEALGTSDADLRTSDDEKVEQAPKRRQRSFIDRARGRR